MSPTDRDSTAEPGESYELFVQLFARHEPALRSFLRPLVPTWDDLEDLLQQTCLVLLKKFKEFQPGTSFLAWACTVARFEALKQHRMRARDRHVFSEELLALLADEGAAEAERRERERRALQSCVERLEPRHRELIQHCYGSGVTIRAAAESMGRTAPSLYKALDRIRLLLLDCIELRLAQEAVP